MKQLISTWDFGCEVHLKPVEIGLINQTWMVLNDSGGAVAVVQRLNTEIFNPILHNDIEAITSHLVKSGLQTPQIIRTKAGDLWLNSERGCYRALTLVGERTIEQTHNLKEIFSAGELIGAFHSATEGLSHRFQFTRKGAHNTPAHLSLLAHAVHNHPKHRLITKVIPLAAEISAMWSGWSGVTALPKRVVHGDLKLSNLRFTGHKAVALIDLDTLANGTLDMELGDAMRSWCNPHSESSEEASFDLAIFEAAMSGYATNYTPTTKEISSIVFGLQRICIELAARFAADALRERYFGFDERYGGRGEHNLLRATGQFALAQDVGRKAKEATAVLNKVFKK